MLAFICSGHKDVGARIEALWIVRREEQREAPLKAVLHGFNTGTHGIVGPGVDVAHGAVLCVEAREQAVVRAGVDEVRIERVGSDPAAFATAYVVPVTLGDGAVVAAAENGDR